MLQTTMPGLRFDLFEKCSAGRNGARAADDGVIGVNAERQKKGMHRAAEALVKTGFLGKNLSQRTVNEKFDRQLFDRKTAAAIGLLDYFVSRAVEKILHDRKQILLIHLMNSGQSFGQNFTVAAMRAENIIVGSKQISLANRRSLLTHRQMRRAGIVVFEAVVCVCGLNRIEHGFEFTDQAHIGINPQEIVFSVESRFLLNGFTVLVDRDILEFDPAGFSDFFGADK